MNNLLDILVQKGEMETKAIQALTENTIALKQLLEAQQYAIGMLSLRVSELERQLKEVSDVR